MKYLYKAMENLGEANGNVALGCHEKVRLPAHGARWSQARSPFPSLVAQLVEQAGVGCIVRVMTDHRRV